MKPELHEELIKETEELRNLVAEYSTESIVGFCYIKLQPQITKDSNQNYQRLTSKVRQVFFLLGLMLTTKEPESHKGFGDPEWETAVVLLESIFNKYFLMFLPKPENRHKVPSEAFYKEGAVLKYFLTYYGNSLLASYEQMIDRINRYLLPFDSEIESALGLTISTALEIAKWICEKFQRQNEELLDLAVKESDIRKALLKEAEENGWTMEKLRFEAEKEGCRELVEDIAERIMQVNKVALTEIEKEFGETNANAFWRSFVSKRGEVEYFQYLTERNKAEETALFEVENGAGFFISANTLYGAILKVGEQVLLREDTKNSFTKKRGKIFDQHVGEVFQSYFGRSAEFFQCVYETYDLQFEHDLIILWNKRLFLIEAKSSPPTVPFRDPEKAFARIERDFQSDTGIQGAYDQAIRVYRQLKQGKPVNLYDDKRCLVKTLTPKEINNIYCMCITRDHYGPLTTDLSLLLRKETSEPFPWVIDILSLESFFDAWRYFRWKPNKFCEFLSQRRRLHEKEVASSDELEIAGYFIRHGSLASIMNNKADLFVLEANYSDIFDEIYWTKFGGPKVEISHAPPFLVDSREMITKAIKGENFGEPVEKVSNKKPGKNDPCFCGSGRKYKKCHLT